MTVFIGDVHGKYNGYRNIIRDCTNSIQVGDMGVGFKKVKFDGVEFTSNPPYNSMVKGGHRFIRGNHDNPEVCRNHKRCIRDGTIENGVMYIGGALSIDRAWRTPGISWWEDEELSTIELDTIIGEALIAQPRVLVTHDCPEFVTSYLLTAMNAKVKINDPSRTRQALDGLYMNHKPKLHIFGHWHISFDQEIDGTRFVCLAELEYKDIDLSSYV